MYSFRVYALPAVFLAPFALPKQRELWSLLRHNFPATLATVVLGATYYYLLLWAFRLAEASIVVPLVEISTLIVVFSDIHFLREERAPKKIVAAVLVIIGAVLLGTA